jgi:hypothetical protein
MSLFKVTLFKEYLESTEKVMMVVNISDYNACKVMDKRGTGDSDSDEEPPPLLPPPLLDCTVPTMAVLASNAERTTLAVLASNAERTALAILAEQLAKER